VVDALLRLPTPRRVHRLPHRRGRHTLRYTMEFGTIPLPPDGASSHTFNGFEGGELERSQLTQRQTAKRKKYTTGSMKNKKTKKEHESQRNRNLVECVGACVARGSQKTHSRAPRTRFSFQRRSTVPDASVSLVEVSKQSYQCVWGSFHDALIFFFFLFYNS
jgi:hypothetical protein